MPSNLQALHLSLHIPAGDVEVVTANVCRFRGEQCYKCKQKVHAAKKCDDVKKWRNDHSKSVNFVSDNVENIDIEDEESLDMFGL